MKAEMPRWRFGGSVIARTTATWPTLAFVMKALVPVSTHSPSSRTARVRIAAASDPEPGSVRPQAPSAWPLASRGRYFAFCSREPNSWRWPVQSELWAHIVMPTDASPRQSSSTMSA